MTCPVIKRGLKINLVTNLNRSRLENIHEIYSYNLYPGPSAKKPIGNQYTIDDNALLLGATVFLINIKLFKWNQQ